MDYVKLVRLFTSPCMSMFKMFTVMYSIVQLYVIMLHKND